MRFRIIFIVLAALFMFSCGFTGGGNEVRSYTSFHRELQLQQEANAPVSQQDRVETQSSLFDGTLMLRPDVAQYSFSVQFDSIPEKGQTALYTATDKHGLESSFIILQGPPPVISITPVNKYASITGIEFGIDDATVNGSIPSGDRIKEKAAFSYEIGWDGSVVRGQIHIAVSSHKEGDLLD